MGRPAPRGHARGHREPGPRPALTPTLPTAPWPARCQVPAALTAAAGGRYGPEGGAGTGAKSAACAQGPIPGQGGPDSG